MSTQIWFANVSCPEPVRTRAVGTIRGVKIARPRLLAASLLIAALVVVAFAWQQSGDSSANGDQTFDAVLDDSRTVVTFPTDGLTNGDVQGEPLPVAMLVDRDGNEVSTADLVGEPLVVNLWFSACAPCAKELPAFAEVDGEVDDVRFVGVNTVDSVAEMERFAGDRGVTYDLLRDQYAELTDGIEAVAFPITLFVTSDGMIVEQTGSLDADELRARVADLRTIEATL
jgi:thiol-disulfide isomerase/thioredoxin